MSSRGLQEVRWDQGEVALGPGVGKALQLSLIPSLRAGEVLAGCLTKVGSTCCAHVRKGLRGRSKRASPARSLFCRERALCTHRLLLTASPPSPPDLPLGPRTTHQKTCLGEQVRCGGDLPELCTERVL